LDPTHPEIYLFAIMKSFVALSLAMASSAAAATQRSMTVGTISLPIPAPHDCVFRFPMPVPSPFGTQPLLHGLAHILTLSTGRGCAFLIAVRSLTRHRVALHFWRHAAFAGDWVCTGSHMIIFEKLTRIRRWVAEPFTNVTFELPDVWVSHALVQMIFDY
jgi:hypothetical protein